MTTASRNLVKPKKTLTVRLDEIDRSNAQFQLRDFLADGVKSHLSNKHALDHIDTLREALKQGQELDPVVVRRNDAGTLEVVDGHHRLEAIRRELGGKTRIKARVLPGDTDRKDALLFAWEANRKDRLPMTKAQKLQAIWRLLWEYDDISCLSSRKLARYFSNEVSQRTACSMKKHLKEYKKDRDSGEEAPLWRDVSARDWEPEGNIEEWAEKRIEELATDLASLIRKKGCDLEILRDALEIAVERSLGCYCDIQFDPDEFLDFAEDDEEEDWSNGSDDF